MTKEKGFILPSQVAFNPLQVVDITTKPTEALIGLNSIIQELRSDLVKEYKRKTSAMTFSEPSTSKTPPDETLQHRAAPSHRDGSPSSKPSNVIRTNFQKDRRGARDQTLFPGWARYDPFSRMLAQIGHIRLKQLMQQAREELNATRLADNTDGEDDEDDIDDAAPMTEEALAKVLGILKEAERIANVLTRELAMDATTESEQEAVAARWEILKMEDRVERGEERPC